MMTNDLVTRLRKLNTFEWHARPATTKKTCFAAADRIEVLEAALREVKKIIIAVIKTDRQRSTGGEER